MINRLLLVACCLFAFPCIAFSADSDEESALADEERLIAAVDNLGPNAAGFVAERGGSGGPDDEDNVDPRVLRDFIESRGLISCRQKTGSLTIAGDVKARWTSTSEVVNGSAVRSVDSTHAVNVFKGEMNLFLDYVTERTWVSTKLRWSAFLGVDGGSATKTDLDRAFIGYDVYSVDKMDFYIELGRNSLGTLFDSRVEFSSFFDGIHFFYTNCWPTVGTFTIHGGPFIVDAFSNHFAWIVETMITNWRGTGLSFKYSFIDWARHAKTYSYGFNEDIPRKDNPRYRFMISQLLIGYEQEIDFLGCKTLYIYGAVLANHDAKRTSTTNNQKLNGAWYAGFTLGKLCKACDWSLDINYQSVQAQAVPDFDLAGIGHGNAAGSLFANALITAAAAANANGFANFKGWQVSLLFAMTDNLSLRSKFEYTVPRNRGIGADFRYVNFEMAVIYAF